MRSTHLLSSRSARSASVFIALVVGGCDDAASTTGSGGGTTGSTTGAAMSTSSTGTTATTTGASTTSSGTTTTSSGSAGTGGAPACTPNEMTSCYSGPPGTEGVGPCKPGVATCLADGSGFGPCMGEVLPASEDCATVIDESCDGAGCGDAIWSRALGSGSLTAAGVVFDVTEYRGSALVAGAFLSQDAQLLNGSGFLRFAPDGTVAEVRVLEQGFGLSSLRVAPGATGALNVAATHAQGMDFGAGPLNGLVVGRLDENGNLVWAKSIASGGTDEFVTGVAEAPGGDVGIVGLTFDGIDFGSGALPNGTFFATVNATTGALVTSASLGSAATIPSITGIAMNRFVIATPPTLKIVGSNAADVCTASLNVGIYPSLVTLANGNILLSHAKANGIELVTIAPDCTVGMPVSVPAVGFSKPRLAVGSTGDVYLSWGTSSGHVVTRRTSMGTEVWTKAFASGGTNDQRMALFSGVSPIVVSLNPSGMIDYGNGPKPVGVTAARLAP